MNMATEEDLEFPSKTKRIKIDLLQNNVSTVSVKENDVPIEVPNDGSTAEPNISKDLMIPNANPSQPMSKKQQKKLRKMANWEEKKKEKRQKEREKYKQRRKEAVEQGLPARIGPSRKALKRNKAEISKNILKVAVDLDFDDLMIDKDIAKCVKQLLRMYTINRRSQTPGKLYFTGVKENGRIHQTLEKNDGYQYWDVTWHFKPYTEVFSKQEIVYLTSESDTVLEALDENTTYIIGGLVDHNHHKGETIERAKKLQLKTARLPLSENVDLKTRSVLSTYHVYEILLRVSEGKDWTNAILETIPIRKGAKPKENPADS